MRTEDLPDFDASEACAEEAVRLEDLEEFKHEFHVDEDSFYDGRHSQLSTGDISLFFQQHQPEAQSTPALNISDDRDSLDLVPLLKQTKIILQNVPPPEVGGTLMNSPNTDLLQDPSVGVAQRPSTQIVSVNDTNIASDVPAEELLRNHSAYNPPSGSTPEDSSSSRPLLQISHALPTLEREIQSSPEARPTEPMQFATAGDMNIPSSLLEQLPHHSSDPTSSLGHKSYPPLPITEWTTPPSYTHLRHATPACSSQPRNSNSNRNPESLGSPIYSYSGPNREPTPSPQHEQNGYSSQYPRFCSPSHDAPQPEAYLPQEGDISVDRPPVTPDSSLPSQPSAYNADPPPLGSVPRLLPAEIAFASVAYHSSALQPLPVASKSRLDSPPAQHDTSDPIVSSSSLEIPGLGANPPPPLPPKSTACDSKKSSSSPIQDFTTSIHSAVNVPCIPGAGIGPKWRFPLAAKNDGRKNKGKDASSSPIQEFSTILEHGDGGLIVSNEDIRTPPGSGLRVLDTTSLPENYSGEGGDPRKDLDDVHEKEGLDHPPATSAALSASESIGVGTRPGEGAQPRDEHESGQGESVDDLYEGLEDGVEDEEGHVDVRQPQLCEDSVRDQARLTRTSTDERLYGEPSVSVETGAYAKSLAPSSNAQNGHSEESHVSASVSSKRSRSPNVNMAEQSKTVEDKTTSPSRKRRRMEMQPLYDLIPEVHDLNVYFET